MEHLSLGSSTAHTLSNKVANQTLFKSRSDQLDTEFIWKSMPDESENDSVTDGTSAVVQGDCS